MIKRALVGLLIGLVVGAGVAAVLTQALGITFAGAGGALFAYLFAGLTGILTGLVAGKPIWSQNGKIEAGLKAFFGALLSMGLMLVLRKWVNVNLDLSAIQAGAGPAGDLPIASLPVIAALLGGAFELDNTPEPEGEAAKGKDGAKVRVGAGASNAVKTADLLEDEEEVEGKKKGRK